MDTNDNKKFYNEETLNIILENISDVIGITDTDGKVLFRSSTNKMLFGYDPAEVTNKQALDYIHPDDQAAMAENLRRLAQGPKNYTLTATCRYRNKDGSYRIIALTGKNMLHDPRIGGILLTYHDETENIKLVKESELTNERYHALIESTGNMVWSVDNVNFGLVTFNTYMANYYKEVLGIELKPGLTPQDMLPENRVAFWMDLYHKVIENGPTRVEYPMVSSDRYLMLSLNPLYINGALAGISVFTIDETELRRATNAIHEESRLYKTLIENMQDFVYELNAFDMTYKLFNPAHASFIKENYGVDITVGQSAIDFMPSDAAALWLNIYNQAKEHEVFHYQYQPKNIDKTINFKLVVLAHGKKDASILVFGEDISAEVHHQKGMQEANRKLSIQLRESISAISKIGELKDVFTAGHQRKVQALACAIAQELECSDETRNNIYMGSLILDIGKVGIPADMINKPGKLSGIEYDILKTHAQMGYNIANEISFSPDVPTMILQHHERLDGSGYPQGLKGDQILLESRILAVCDVVEAMCSHRPYRPALGITQALEEIKTYRGVKYDTSVVDACVALFEQKGFVFPKIDF